VRLRERLYLSLARSRTSGADAVVNAYRGALDRIRAGAEAGAVAEGALEWVDDDEGYLGNVVFRLESTRRR